MMILGLLVFIFCMLVAASMSEDKYYEDRRKAKAERLQKRVLEARKGYRNMG